MIALLLAAAVAASAATASPVPVTSAAAPPASRCRADQPVSAMLDGQAPKSRRLGELPPGRFMFAVIRAAQGCQFLQVLDPRDGGMHFELAPQGEIERLSHH